MLIDLHLQGRLPLDAFVSETIALDQVEEAFAAMHRGECCGRSSCSERPPHPQRQLGFRKSCGEEGSWARVAT